MFVIAGFVVFACIGLAVGLAVAMIAEVLRYRNSEQQLEIVTGEVPLAELDSPE